MSRGLGRRQRALLEALAEGPGPIESLVGSSDRDVLVASRRAMRQLVERGLAVEIGERDRGRRKIFAHPDHGYAVKCIAELFGRNT